MNPIHPNDPKKEAGAKKTPLHLLPPYALAQTALAHAEGAKKYGLFNWRTNQVCATTYIGAILRHLTAWQDGEDIDADSGLSHIAKIGACCNILLDAGHCGTLVDDRSKVPSKEPSPSNQQRLDEHLKNLDETSKLLAAKWREKEEQQLRKIFNDLVAEHAKRQISEMPNIVIDPTAEPHGIGKVMAEIEAAVEKTVTPSHPPTHCCNYRAELSNAYPVFWNPFNKVVQCHNCGHQYGPFTDSANTPPNTPDDSIPPPY